MKLINCALGCSAGYARLKMSSNPLVYQLVKKSQNSDSSLIKVKVKTMDELCENIGIQRLNWVKIDVEGGASDVLKGGLQILRHPTKIIIEIPDNETLGLLAKLEYSTRPLLSLNSKLGYYYSARARIPMQAVIYLKTNLEEAREMGINGVKYVESHVSVKAVGSEPKKVFEERMQRFDDFSKKQH